MQTPFNAFMTLSLGITRADARFQAILDRGMLPAHEAAQLASVFAELLESQSEGKVEAGIGAGK